MEVGHFCIFNEVTESRCSHVQEVVPGWHILDGVSELVYAVPVQLLWLSDVS